MFASFYFSWLIIRDCRCHKVFWWSDKGNVYPVAVKNDLQFQFLIVLHYLLKAQEDCECAQALWSMLDWRSRVLLWSFFSKLCALPGPLSSLEITPCIYLPPHSSHSSPVKSVPSASVATNSLCFLTGKHVLVSSLVIQVTLLLMDVQNGTGWGSRSLQLVRLVTPWLWRCNLSYILLSLLHFPLFKKNCCIKDPSWRLAQPPVKPAFSLPFFGVTQDFGVSKDWGAPPLL